MDHSGRFQNGRLIRTSRIIRVKEQQGWTIVITFSGSHYLLIEDEGEPCFAVGSLLIPGTVVNGIVH